MYARACPQPFDSTSPFVFKMYFDDDGWPLVGCCQVCFKTAFVHTGGVVCRVCMKAPAGHQHTLASSTPFAGRVAGTAANGSGGSSSSSNNVVAVDVADVAAVGGIDEGKEEPNMQEQEEDTEEHFGLQFIVRSDGVVEPAPGHGKYRPHRKRGKASRAKSRASYHAE